MKIFWGIIFTFIGAVLVFDVMNFINLRNCKEYAAQVYQNDMDPSFQYYRDSQEYFDNINDQLTTQNNACNNAYQYLP